MKLVGRRKRILALLIGLVVLATLITQIIRDGRRLQMKNVTNIQSKIK